MSEFKYFAIGHKWVCPECWEAERYSKRYPKAKAKENKRNEPAWCLFCLKILFKQNIK